MTAENERMTQTSTDQSTILPPKRTRGGARNLPQAVPGEGSFQPLLPTSGMDLITQWDLPESAWAEGRIKITRNRYASQVLELVDEVSIQDYAMAKIAKRYGPGDYFLYLSPSRGGLWKQKNCKICLSAEYAESVGYRQYQEPTERPPLPNLREASALQAVSDAMGENRPLTVRDLAGIIETVSDRTAKAIQGQAPVNGMGPHEVMAFMDSMNKINDRAEEKMLRMFQTMNGHAADEPPARNESDSWGAMVGPAITALMGALQRPAPPQPTLTATQEPPMQIPLSQAEADQFSGAARMLAPFVGTILQAMAAQPNPTIVAADFIRWIPEPLEDQLIQLEKLTQERGPLVLGRISPQLATPQGAALMHALALALQESN
jgi:hypothetical protein